MSGLDLTGLSLSIAVGVFLVAVGVGIDKLVTPSQKNSLSETLTSWWVAISDLEFKHLTEFWIISFLKLKNALLGPGFFTPRTLISIGVLSVTATLCFILYGNYLWFNDIERSVDYFPTHKPIILFPVCFTLDVLTVLITYHAFLLMKNRNKLAKLSILLVDIFVAIFLSVVAMNITHSLEFWGGPGVTITSHGIDTHYLKLTTQGYFSYWQRIGVINWDWSILKEITNFTGGWIGPRTHFQGGEYGVFLSTWTAVVSTLLYCILFLLLCQYLLYVF